VKSSGDYFPEEVEELCGRHRDLFEAVEGVKVVAKRCNALMGEKAMQRRVFELSQEWGVDFTATGRHLVKEGVLVKTDKRSRENAVTVLLFNDMVAYGDKNLGVRRLRAKFLLKECMVVDNHKMYSPSNSSGEDVNALQPVSAMSTEERNRVARDNDLNLELVKGDEELTRYLEVLQNTQTIGVEVVWHWEETAGRFKAHEEKNRYGDGTDGCWIKYANILGAQLEYFYQAYAEQQQDDGDDGGGGGGGGGGKKRGSRVVEVDVDGRCNDGGGSKGAFDHANTGTVYQVDFERMVQINVKSKFERKVFRREDKVAAAEVREHRTWDRFALNLGINLSHLKASLLDDTAFLVGTPVK